MRDKIKELEEKLSCKEQECEELKKELKHYKQIAQYHGNLSVKYTNKSAKLKQTLAEIKEITNKVLLNTHDLELFKEADALFSSLLEIHKIIREVEDEY